MKSGQLLGTALPARTGAHRLWKILSAPQSAGTLAFLAFVIGVVVNRATGIEAVDDESSSLLDFGTTGHLRPCTAQFLDYSRTNYLVWMEHGTVLGSVLCTLIRFVLIARSLAADVPWRARHLRLHLSWPTVHIAYSLPSAHFRPLQHRGRCLCTRLASQRSLRSH